MFIEPKSTLHELKHAIIQLSDYFINNPKGSTPWDKSYCQLAYTHYFLPLNYLRNKLVVERGQQVSFFEGLDAVVDWGAGPGTASLALSSVLDIKNYHLVEKSKTCANVFKSLQHQYLPASFQYNDLSEIKNLKKTTSLLVMSYSLTEVDHLPKEAFDYEALMILEPSTQDDGRRLMQWRTELISKGYSIYAPCIHAGSCPLLLQSKHDWCHDRLHVIAPDWFKKLDELLPFKNKTITTSYILARKKKNKFDSNGKARLVGDSLQEKGKTKQLLCMNEERQFLTWMHKEIQPEVLNRGDLIDLPEKLEKKSNELRVKK